MIGMRYIEGNEGCGKMIAIDETVDAASAIGGLVVENHGSSTGVARSEDAGGGEDPVAGRFEIGTGAIPLPEIGIRFIDELVLLRPFGGQAESPRSENEAVKIFHRSPALMEANSQKVEQWE